MEKEQEKEEQPAQDAEANKISFDNPPYPLTDSIPYPMTDKPSYSTADQLPYSNTDESPYPKTDEPPYPKDDKLSCPTAPTLETSPTTNIEPSLAGGWNLIMLQGIGKSNVLSHFSILNILEKSVTIASISIVTSYVEYFFQDFRFLHNKTLKTECNMPYLINYILKRFQRRWMEFLHHKKSLNCFF